MVKKRGIVAFCLGFMAIAMPAQNKVTLNGSIQSDILIPQEDTKIGTGS